MRRQASWLGPSQVGSSESSTACTGRTQRLCVDLAFAFKSGETIRIMLEMILAQTASGLRMVPPDDVMQSPAFASKAAMELAHLQHFERLTRARFGHLQFDVIGPGTDPPDFLISRSGVRVGLEHTVFAWPERRERAAFFSKLHDRLLDAYGKGRLRGLSGMKVELSFGDLGARPFNVSNALFDELVDSFDELAKKKRPARSSDSEAQGAWPSGTVSSLTWCVSSYANFPLSGSKLANDTGFDVEYTQRQWTTPANVEQALNDSIAIKDQAGVDELLIVAGGPDQAGRQFPAEAMLVDYLLGKLEPSFVRPTYLRRVFVDVWGLERLYLIHEA